MVMSRPALIKRQTQEMTSNRIFGHESRSSGMRYKAFCWLDKDAMVNGCIAYYAFEVMF